MVAFADNEKGTTKNNGFEGGNENKEEQCYTNAK